MKFRVFLWLILLTNLFCRPLLSMEEQSATQTDAEKVALLSFQSMDAASQEEHSHIQQELRYLIQHQDLHSLIHILNDLILHEIPLSEPLLHEVSQWFFAKENINAFKNNPEFLGLLSTISEPIKEILAYYLIQHHPAQSWVFKHEFSRPSQEQMLDIAIREKTFGWNPPRTFWIMDHVYWSPQKNLCAAIDPSDSRNVKIWNPWNGDCKHILRHNSIFFKNIVWNKQETLLATSEDNIVRIWDVNTGKCIQQLNHTGSVDFIYWSPKGNMIATQMYDKISSKYFIMSWDIHSGRCLQQLIRKTTSPGAHYYIRWNPEQENIIAILEDRSIKLWNPLTGECEKIFKIIKTHVSEIHWSPSGNMLTFEIHDYQHDKHEEEYSVNLWDLRTKTYALQLKDYEIPRWENEALWNHDENLIALAPRDDDRVIHIWNIDTGTLVHELKHNESVYEVKWNASGNLIAIISKDKSIQIWDAKTGYLIHEFNHQSNLKEGDKGWNPQGNLFATRTYDEEVRVWDAMSGEKIHEHKSETKINDLYWNEDGNQIITITMDKMIRIWNMTDALINAPLNSPLKKLSLEQVLLLIATYEGRKEDMVWELSEVLLPHFNGLNSSLRSFINTILSAERCPICFQNKEEVPEEKWQATPCCHQFICQDDLAILRARGDRCPICREDLI